MFVMNIMPWTKYFSLFFLRFGSDHSLNGSDQDLSGDCAAAPFQDSQGLFTETGVCVCVRAVFSKEGVTTDNLIANSR